MADIYERYTLSRIHSDWSYMAGESFRLADPQFRWEVLQYSRQILSRAKRSIEMILERLYQEGYHFVYPEDVYRPPEPDIEEWIRKFEHQKIYLPISLQAWLLEIGSINIMGTHPCWEKTAYVFENMPSTNDVWYTDPLVIELKMRDVECFYEEWKMRVEEHGGNEVGPFKIEIAPDHIHKANISGGPPYEMMGNIPVVDSIVFNERHCTSFINYVRIAINWGGFPGFEYISDISQNNIFQLRKSILSI